VTLDSPAGSRRDGHGLIVAGGRPQYDTCMGNSSFSLDDILRTLTADSAPELARALGGGRIQCLACAHLCRVSEGHSGACRVRFVEKGALRRPRGYVAAVACDPIEKKPFFTRFRGGTP